MKDSITVIDNMTEKALKDGIASVIDGVKVASVGFTMLRKIKGGKKFRLQYFHSKAYGDCVTFYPLRGSKPVASHSAWSVLSSIQSRANGSLNGLELI